MCLLALGLSIGKNQVKCITAWGLQLNKLQLIALFYARQLLPLLLCLHQQYVPNSNGQAGGVTHNKLLVN